MRAVLCQLKLRTRTLSALLPRLELDPGRGHGPGCLTRERGRMLCRRDKLGARSIQLNGSTCCRPRVKLVFAGRREIFPRALDIIVG